MPWPTPSLPRRARLLLALGVLLALLGLPDRVAAAEPAKPTQPATATRPARGTEPPRPTEPAKATEPARAPATVTATQPAPTARPVQTAQPPRATEPAYATAPRRPTEPVATPQSPPATPAIQPTEPAHATEPTPTTQPGPAAEPTPTTTPTRTPAPRRTPVPMRVPDPAWTEAPASADGAAPADQPVQALLALPFRSQVDDSPYTGANCGPASLAMVLGGFGLNVPTDDLRALVNDLQDTWEVFDSGTAIHTIAAIARRYGLVALDLADARGLRRWTPDDVRRHLIAGRPVIAQVWYPGIPGRANAAYRGDHFVVIVGFDGDEFIFHDPADPQFKGGNRRMTGEELTATWATSGLPFAGLAFARSGARLNLPVITPRPTRTPTATVTPTPEPTATPTATAEPTSTPTSTPTAAVPPLATPSPSPTLIPAAAATGTHAPTPTAIPTATATPGPVVGALGPRDGPPMRTGSGLDWLGGWSLLGLLAAVTVTRSRRRRLA